MSDIEQDILYRLSYRKGQLIQQGWPWRQKDIRLLDEAVAEIQRLRSLSSPEQQKRSGE